ncbi:MAG TPA: type III pantothenate kinase [Rhodocyclaceae bacterium]|nr:type III pantothenate kinase [Rhodocyclaceae bacterium]
MILVVDAGNTRIKWGVVRDGIWLGEGALAHDAADALEQVARAHPGVTHVFGANVAGPTTGARIEAALHTVAPPIQWLRASAHRCGVRNLYDEPSQLGVDRWAALIGAHALHRGACLVVNAGTATTIDMLAASGEFCGGLILPGDELMRRALAGNTAQLPFAAGHYRTAPRNTADAIASGCLTAQLGAITLTFERLAAQPNAVCLLSGGGAARLEPLMTIPFRRVDNLVLKGLAHIAASEPVEADERGC